MAFENQSLKQLCLGADRLLRRVRDADGVMGQVYHVLVHRKPGIAVFE